jgi:hypothetical protein
LHQNHFDEVLNVLRIRLWRKLPAFDPGKGRVFTFISLIAGQSLTEIWAKRNLHAQRYPEASIEILDCLQYSRSNGNDDISRAAALEDITWRVYQTRTVCSDPYELKAQRWLVRGQLAAGFQLRRHQAADSMVIVYGLEPRRARQIHDATLLEVRRTLIGLVEIPKITLATLKGTRQSALARYAPQLSSADFSRLIFLMRNLSPVAVIGDNLDHVLNGYPNARLLFAEQLNSRV